MPGGHCSTPPASSSVWLIILVSPIMIISSMCSGLVGIGGPDYDGMVVALGQEDADDWLSGAEMRAIISEQG